MSCIGQDVPGARGSRQQLLPPGSRGLPGQPERLRYGHGVRARALAHAVQLKHGDVQTQKEFQRLPGDGRSPRVALGAPVQPNGLSHLPVHQVPGEAEVHRHFGAAAGDKGLPDLSHRAELLPLPPVLFILV